MDVIGLMVFNQAASIKVENWKAIHSTHQQLKIHNFQYN